MTTKRRKRQPAMVSPDRTVSPLGEELPKQSPSLPGQQELPVDLPKIGSGGVMIPRPGLIDYLKQLDMEAFLDDWTLEELRRRVIAKYGAAKATRVSARELRVARDLAFDWYRKRSLYPESSRSALSEEQWMLVKARVSSVLHLMHGRTLRQCVRIARTTCQCNASILRGLPSRFHVWR